MKKRTTAMAAGALALALALGACANNTPTDGTSGGTSTGTEASFTNTNAHPYSDLKQGGTLNLSATEFTEQKNPFHADGTVDTTFLWAWYNAELIKFKPNGDININKDYLTDVKDEVVDGNTVVTYTMNPEAKFNDGTPMDIKAWVNTWTANNGSNEEYFASSTDGYNKVKSVEAGKDDFQIVVTFNGPWPWWGGMFNFLLHPAVNTPELYNTAYVGNDLASAHPEWGVGPYKLESLDATAGTATLVPNELWWGDKAKLDQVNLVQRESTAAINAFANGETDYVGASTADVLNQVKDVPDTDTRVGASTSNWMLQLNSQTGVLKDKIVRQAIMTAVDREQVAKVRFQGLDYTEEFPGSFLLFTFQEGYQDNFAQVIPKSDVAAAKKLLEDEGYVMGDSGFYAKDGTQLDVHYTLFGDSASSKALAQVFQQQMKAAGINMIIDQKASADFSDIMAKGEWEMNFSGFSSGDPFGVAYTCQVWCSGDEASGLNKSGVGSDALNKEIHEMEALPTAEEQIAAANKIEVKMFAEYGLMPIFNGPTQYQVKSNLANVGASVFAAQGNALGDFRQNIGFLED
ncbi:MAG: ABC transporter family substrate-binding protein [Propionibacteriaceae bacterium]|jgi:peptide/nickel transport system substrate-binding protein|nr:ABC transporter family substrate-binding protein [Propionibacteriaceae bacterium]